MSSLTTTSCNHINLNAKQICVCSCCGWGIYTGDTYYEKYGKKICEDCNKEESK